MTPTEELRAKLDELGVEHDTYDLPNGEHGVSWIDGNNIEWEVVQLGENFEIHALQLVTPEQAVAATVGRGTCHVKAVKKLGDSFGFSLSCGHSMVNPFDDRPDYCPWCGAKVMDE